MVAGVLFYNLVAFRLRNFQPGDLGLGIATTAHEVQWNSLPINQTHGNFDLVVPTIQEFRKQGNRVAVLMGNSQLHSINYYEEGHNLTVYYLNQLAVNSESNLRFAQLTSPNINFMEMLVYYLSLRHERCKPDWLIIGATYRSFQLTSMRQSFVSNLAQLNLRDCRLTAEVESFYGEELNRFGNVNQSKVGQTNQEQIESGINGYLADHWNLYTYRGNVRSAIKVMPGLVYRKFFSKDNVFVGSESVELLNLTFLRELIRLCTEDGVKVLIYRPPHPRTGEKFEYNLTAYERCFAELARLENKNKGIYFADLERVVSVDDWGLDATGKLDIFHFRNRGHELLADSIFDLHFLKP